jgi:exopolyphosphatase/guanosine-5'-triphosphate,3'-diphosphate pyrophosphatase
MDLSEGRPEKARAIVDAELERLPGLERLRGKALYAVGGVWRNIARMHLENVQHPVRILHNYEIMRDRAIDFTSLIAGLSRKSLESAAGVTRKRAEAIPYGAIVMERLLKIGRLDRVIISAFGVREGLLFSRLPEDERARDPLLAACEDMSRRLGRDASLGSILAQWTAPLFQSSDKGFDRLRRAACHLADTGWRGHPDHRAELIYEEVLNAPFIGIDHQRRNLLALALFHRYGGADEKREKRAIRFIGEDAAARARSLGLAIRAGLVLAGPSPTVLQATAVRLTPTALILSLPRRHQALMAEASSKRFEMLSEAFGRSFRTELR